MQANVNGRDWGQDWVWEKFPQSPADCTGTTLTNVTVTVVSATTVGDTGFQSQPDVVHVRWGDFGAISSEPLARIKVLRVAVNRFSCF
jgi:hypothetical protein